MTSGILLGIYQDKPEEVEEATRKQDASDERRSLIIGFPPTPSFPLGFPFSFFDLEVQRLQWKGSAVMEGGDATEAPTMDPGDVEQRDSWGLFLLLVVLFLSISLTYVLLRTRFRFLPESIVVIVIGKGPLKGG